MNLVFNSPQAYIIDYPGNDAVEIFDKRSGRLALIQGPLAARFRREFDSFIHDAPDEEKLETLIDGYSTLLNQATRH